MLADLGETQQARQLAEDTATRWRQVHGDDHMDTMQAVDTLISVLEKSRDFEQAASLANESLARHQRLFGEAHPDTRAAAEKLAQIKDSLSEALGEARRQGHARQVLKAHSFPYSPDLSGVT